MDKNISLERSNKKFEMLFKYSPVGMVMVAYKTGKILELNPAFIKSIGYSKDELLELSIFDITPQKYHGTIMAELEEIERHGELGPHYKEYIRKDGSTFPVKVSGFKMIDIDGTELIWGIVEDISERVEFEKKLQEAAKTDYLTGLDNRRGLNEKINFVIEISKKMNKDFYLLTIDLDKFKSINDKFGHQLGDQVLVEISDRMKLLISDTSNIIARTGGDEFIVILSGIEGLSPLYLDNLLHLFSAPIKVKDINIEISASIGISKFPTDGDNLDDLFKISDKRAYMSKEKGGNCYTI